MEIDQIEQKYCNTAKIGKRREKRVQFFVKKNWNWNCYKSNLELDKYHSIDLVAYNKNSDLIFIQVKGLKMINKIKFDEKAIRISKQHNATLYYFFVGNRKEKVYAKKVK